MSTTGIHIDHRTGGLRLAADPTTRITTEQATALEQLADIEDIGAAEPRLGDRTGNLIVFHTTGRVTEITETGEQTDITTEDRS